MILHDRSRVESNPLEGGAARGRFRTRRGSVLVEFAFIAIILYLLLAGIIEFGRGMFAAQVIQQAADAAARELSRTPMPPTGILTGDTGILRTNAAAKQIYDEQFLLVDKATIPANQSLADFFIDKPLLNRLLMPLMINDTVNNMYRYPGRIVDDATVTGGKTVVIDLIQYQNGGETVINTVPVVEEIASDATNADVCPFNLLATGLPAGQRGFIALRINYPFQAATMGSFQGPREAQMPTTTDEAGDFGPYTGDSGRGKLFIAGRDVRPFRKVLSAQAIFRREIFE
jgi:Flp pilus assembly protein TadG